MLTDREDAAPADGIKARHRYFETSDGVKIHYLEAGDPANPTMVMMPGWSQSAAMFRHQINDLGDEFHIVAVDPRGHGDSEAPDFGYNAHRLTADIRELILALDLRDIVLFGHSSGVKYIWAYWELYGADRLSRLVIADDSPRLTDNPGWTEKDRAEVRPMFSGGGLDDFARDLLAPGDNSFTRTAMAGMFSEAYLSAHPDEFDWIVAENLKMPRDKSMELLYATSSVDWRGTIKRVNLPALVIGAEGSTHKVEVLTWVASQIPGAKLRIWKKEEGGSHFMFLENPRQFNAELRAFLREGSE
ncbi:MAG: alpha/beta hydrolase [Hyphomicrobiaceae bacterium]|nr:alpha/beta hydrolase [Hyphomicrobiaceae bacterium]